MPIWVSAALWGLLGASSLILGAAVAFLVRLPTRLTGGIMAFGCGVLISAVAYDLLEDGFKEGGIWRIVAGGIVGLVVYTVAAGLVSRNGGQNRKRSGHQQKNREEGGALLPSIGSLLDGISES